MHGDVEIVGLVCPASRVGLAYAPVSSSSTDALEELGLEGGVMVKGCPVVVSVDVDGLVARRTPRGGPSFAPGGNRANISALDGR